MIDFMVHVVVRDGESLERALKRFKRKCEKEKLTADIRRRERHEKPSVKKRRKAMAALKRARKKQRK